jgi:hypothetical protein
VAEVVTLRPNESPPGDVDRVMVTRDSSSQHKAEGPFVRHSRGATFYMPHPPTDLDRDVTIMKARAWADEQGIATVYVQD